MNRFRLRVRADLQELVVVDGPFGGHVRVIGSREASIQDIYRCTLRTKVVALPLDDGFLDVRGVPK
jgi:hypothetical protein